MGIVWFLSCFTSFAINQNDFEKEFGDAYMPNEKKQKDDEVRLINHSERETSPNLGLVNRSSTLKNLNAEN